MGVFLMGLFGKIGKAIGGAFKAVGNGLQEVGKQVGLFAGGVVSGFVLKPVAGVVSLFSEDLAAKIQLPWQDQIDNSFMGKVGNFAGTALGFVGGTALLRGVGMGATAARTALGAVQGLAGSAEGSLWDKIKGAGFGALTAGAAGKLGDKVGAWVQKGEDVVLQPLANAGAPRAVTQGVDRLMDAQLSSLVRRGRLADWDEIIPATAVSAVVSNTDYINDGIDKLIDKLPEGQATTALSRVLNAEADSLARTGRFADSGVVISQAIPDGVNVRIDRLISSVSDSENRFNQTVGQFFDNQVDTFREQGRFVDPRMAFAQAASREFAPEIDRVIDRTSNIDRVGDVMSSVLRTEADSLQQYGRLHNPGSALQKAVMEEIRPTIDRFGQRLPSPAGNAINDMLNEFTIDGMNGVTRSAENSLNQHVQRYADQFLTDRIFRTESVEPRSPRIDSRELHA